MHVQEPTIRLFHPETECTSTYLYEDDQNVDKCLRGCIKAINSPAPDFNNSYKIMDFFSCLERANLLDESITKVKGAVQFLVEHSDSYDKVQIAIDRIAACIILELKEKDFLASAYYGVRPAFPNLDKETLEEVFGSKVVDKLEGIESVTAEQAADLGTIAKRAKLIAYYTNSDRDIERKMSYTRLSDYQKRIRPIWEACMLCNNERVSKTTKALFEKREKIATEGPPDGNFKGYLNEGYPNLIRPFNSSVRERHWGHPGIKWDYINSVDVGGVLNVEGTILKIGKTVIEQGFFLEIGKMEIAFMKYGKWTFDIIVKNLQDEINKPSIKDYKSCPEVKKFASYLRVRGGELLKMTEEPKKP